LNEPPPIEIITSNPSISRFADLLGRMLAKKPDDRPEVSEVMEALRKELVCTIPPTATGPIPAVPSSVSGRRGAVRLIGDIYQIQRELGSGGMGTVFLALDTSLNRQVAIKLMNESNARDTALVERFIREGQLLATVGHPNIMNIYASAIDPESGRPFLVMEYIDGVSLSSLKQNLLKERRNVPALMLQLFEGIAACHARGIIHRDLKPSNIMVTRAGMLKVLDFGIAKSSSNITKTGITMGTPEYMSPEQCMGVKDLTPASDVYTMGVIFWELIYGETPFKPDNAENPELSIAMKHVHATLPASVLIPDESFAPLLPLVRKMLDKSPTARPRLDELIQALDVYVEAHLGPNQALPATRRKSRSIRTSGLQELLSGAEEATAGSFLMRRSTWLGAGGIAIAAALTYTLFLGRPDNAKLLALLKAQLEQQLAAGQLQEAVRTLTELESEPGGSEAVVPFRGRLAELLSEKARASVAAGNASPALSLYDLARQIDPGNATATGGFASVKASIDAMIAAEANRAGLVKRSRELLPLILPGSGTEELASLLGGLHQEGLATEATSIESAWIETFLSSGDAELASDPTRALEFFEEIRKRFSSTPGIDERVAAARKRQEEEQARLRQTRETADLVARLDEASRAFTPTSDPAAFIALCDTLAQKGERATADTYRRAAAARLFEAAETLQATGKKSEAVEAMKRASGIFPDLPGLGDRLRQSEDLIASERAAAERAAALGKRLSDISAEIQSIHPPAPVDALLTKIGEVETTLAAASDAANLRRTIFDKYLSAAQGIRDTDPDTALAILAECGKTGVSADLIASETSSVKRLISARDAADAERKRAAELEKQVGILSTEIGSLVPPAPIDGVIKRIGEMETAFAAASAAAELRQAVFVRYLSAAQNRRDSSPESAMAILAECRKTGIQPDTVASEASFLSQRVAERAAQAAKQKRITDVSADLSKLVKNPAAKGGGAIQALLDELSKLGEAEQAASFRASALEAVRKQATEVRTDEDAQEIRHAMKGLVEAGSDEEKEISSVIEASLKAWRTKRTQEIETALAKAKPAEYVQPVVELLRELAAFDEPERVKTATEVLKKKYLESASRLK
ncbi:protein kinase, partial [Candidatus Ozemobacteraceae bacterium]|nr:protein kinase [Candidatus Ozemobacteraceae bacterium]